MVTEVGTFTLQFALYCSAEYAEQDKKRHKLEIHENGTMVAVAPE